MLIAAAVCPHPPLLVPEIAGLAAPELDGLRAACRTAVDSVLAAGGDLVVVGGGEHTRAHPGTASGTFAPWGLDLRVGDGAPVLPLSLTVGRWLLDGREPSAFQEIASDASEAECLELGERLAARDVALLVMGDGSACRDEKAPGYFDERAAPYDAEVARALGEADAAALGRLDPKLSEELMAAGRAAWQVLAGAAGGRRFAAALLADEAPYGVGYFAAVWR
ncbi:class III extradiol dioxygenase subunit B-like domain-containing protein [Actinocorallia sp. A-T 12471]|uniref:class III extradiol dioxygenase subunit B-like domain-containing protein n=1 Tax=Actinocorallia sp. A-T 12471 TaxID=3089813 RepID=UPI0029D1E98D|nr:class III extradiol dioxygenase subunit B-like domain-containing protein [Actinocorallia sp. A-T 12471]MDX6743462.1 class III extradiol dioxygenase subunit B-like domain-containing protein [Actinocorallia sp. A-T 12471]